MEKDLDLPQLLRSRLTVTATNAALKAGHTIKRTLKSNMSFSVKKGRHNIVTETDKKVEEEIINTIKHQFPEHSFLAEESGESGEKGNIRWIIDPIDGTLNYAHQVPLFCVSIAATFGSDILAGIIYNPMTEELFIAEKGYGAYLNGEKLKVSQTAILDSAILATSFPYNAHENPLNCLDHFNTFSKMGLPIRKIGSAALTLAYVAAGRYDAFWSPSLSPWDYAAGKLLLEEAGGQVRQFSDEPISSLDETSIIASNKVLHSQLLKNIQSKLDNTGSS